MKRRWLMIPLATGVLVAGLTGASVLAHNGDAEEQSPKDAVAAKVAEALGLDQPTVKDALQAATQEVRSDRLEHRLGHMVEEGKLTQEQADSYLEWYEARPEGPNLHRGGHRLFRFGGGEGENSGPHQRFSGLGQGADGGQTSSFRQLPNGRDFPGRAGLRSGFGQGSFGQGFHGQDSYGLGFGLESPAQAGEAAGPGGVSY